jgi:hypothetical protein
VEKRKGKHRKTFHLSTTKTVSAGKTLTILLKLPSKALSTKAKDSITLNLAATNFNGIGTTRLKPKKLRIKKH